MYFFIFHKEQCGRTLPECPLDFEFSKFHFLVILLQFSISSHELQGANSLTLYS